MVIHFEKLSKALDAFNAHRAEDEQMEWHEVVSEIKNPLDETEVLRIIADLYEEAFEFVVTIPHRQGSVGYYNIKQSRVQSPRYGRKLLILQRFGSMPVYPHGLN